MDTVAEYVDGLPSLCGQEPLISEAIEAGRQRPVFINGLDIERAASPSFRAWDLWSSLGAAESGLMGGLICMFACVGGGGVARDGV